MVCRVSGAASSAILWMFIHTLNRGDDYLDRMDWKRRSAQIRDEQRINPDIAQSFHDNLDIFFK